MTQRPRDPDALDRPDEWRLISSLLITDDAIWDVRDLLAPFEEADRNAAFRSNLAGVAFRAICHMADTEQPASIRTMCAWASVEPKVSRRLAFCGGVEALRAQLVKLATQPSLVNPRATAAALADDALQRRLASWLAIRSEELKWPQADLAVFLDALESELMDMRPRGSVEPVGAKAIGREILLKREEGVVREPIPTGLVQVDHLLGGGFDPGQLVFIGARTSVGKTAVTLDLCRRMARLGAHCQILSLEMTPLECFSRIIAAECGVDSRLIYRHNWPDEKTSGVMAGMMRANGLPLQVIHEPNATIFDALSHMRRAAAKGVKVFCVDYFGRLRRAKSQPKEWMVYAPDNARLLKTAAQKLGLVVMVPIQVKPDVDHRKDQRPLLADFYGGGKVHAECDTALALYRDEIARESADSRERTKDPIQKGVIELLFRKQRSGPRGTVRLGFDPALSRLEPQERLLSEVRRA